jgi:AcrR family transcriptional regulator
MSSRTEGPRERLLRAASELTYTQGVGVGIDAILKDADVARRSLYQHFGSKDGLLAEVIRVKAAETERKYADALAMGGDDPAERLLAVFDYLEEYTFTPGYRGCRFVASTLAIPDPDHAAREEARAHKRRVHEMFAAEFRGLGHPDPAQAADQFQLLIEGAMSLYVNRPESHPARAARALAESLVRSARTA